MSPKSSKHKATAERVVKDIRRKTRRHVPAEDKIRIVLEGHRGALNGKAPYEARREKLQLIQSVSR